MSDGWIKLSPTDMRQLREMLLHDHLPEECPQWLKNAPEETRATLIARIALNRARKN